MFTCRRIKWDSTAKLSKSVLLNRHSPHTDSMDKGNASAFSASLSKQFSGFAYRDTLWFLVSPLSITLFAISLRTLSKVTGFLHLHTGGFLHDSKALRERVTEYPISHSTFNGKEKDYESGFHYYGARYYWSEVLTG